MRNDPYARALGIYPCQTGFGFAVIERGRGLVDWGEAELGRDSDEEFVRRVRLQIERSSPALLALEKTSDTSRGAKAKRRVDAALALATHLCLKSVELSPYEVREGLSVTAGATKHDLVDQLCEMYPELTRQKPVRSIWKRDPRINVFNAVALAVGASRTDQR